MDTWFMIENHLDQKETLAAARVAFSELKVTKPREITGLAFPESEKEKVFQILGIPSAVFEETQTDQGNVILLVAREVKVVLESRENMEAWDKIEPVLKEFSQLLGVDIHTSNLHGSPADVKTEAGKLYIRFWSTPRKTDEDRIHRVFGIEVYDGQHDGRKPSGDGIPIVDGEGVIVAEICGGTLYILFDLPHKKENAAALLTAIMDQYLALQKSPEERDRLLQEATDRERKRSQEAYVKECGKRLTQTIKATESEIKSAQQTIVESQKRIVDAVRSEEGFRKKLQQLQDSAVEAETRFATEFERLLAVPGVIKVVVKEGLISVFTDQIDLDYDNEIYDIGKFRIDIRTDGGSGGVNCHNLTRKVEGYYHPHVEGSGSCCLGNIADGVAKLIGAYEYSVLAQLMIQYLRSVNSGSWYKSVGNWPKKEKES